MQNKARGQIVYSYRIGGSLARATLGLVRSAAREMLDRGTFSFSGQQIPDEELCGLFAERCRSTQH